MNKIKDQIFTCPQGNETLINFERVVYLSKLYSKYAHTQEEVLVLDLLNLCIIVNKVHTIVLQIDAFKVSDN